MKRKTIVATSIGAAVVLALGGGYAYSASNNSPVVGVAQATVAPLTVTVSASGSPVAAHSAGVYPPATGTVAKVLVADGATVKAGDTLAVMATGPLKLAVAQARAALSAARAQGEAVDNGVPGAIDRSAANAALSAARSQVSTAKKNYASFRDHYDSSDAAQRATLRTLNTARTQASAALQAAKAALNRRHVRAIARGEVRRGPLRDAATLLDECGVLVPVGERALAEALTGMQWKTLFIAAVTALGVFIGSAETLGKATAKLIDKVFPHKNQKVVYTKEDLEKVRRAAEMKREAQEKAAQAAQQDEGKA